MYELVDIIGGYALTAAVILGVAFVGLLVGRHE